MPEPTTRRTVAAAAAVALLIAGCGGSDDGSAASAPDLSTITAPEAAGEDAAAEADPTAPPADGAPSAPPTEDAPSTPPAAATAPAVAETDDSGDEPTETPRGENQLPDVTVVDLASGDEVSLASFAPAAQPIVLWFWAPH